MKIKASKIAFISFHLFFRIGTFQWVIGEKNKKIRLVVNSRVRLCLKLFFPLSSSAKRPQVPGAIRHTRKT
jgi:hypothetical protein